MYSKSSTPEKVVIKLNSWFYFENETERNLAKEKIEKFLEESNFKKTYFSEYKLVDFKYTVEVKEKQLTNGYNHLMPSLDIFIYIEIDKSFNNVNSLINILEDIDLKTILNLSYDRGTHIFNK